MHTIERNGKSKLNQILPTSASQDNGIKTDVVVVDAYPVLPIDDFINKISPYVVFSKTDLKSAYHQIQIHEDDKLYTASAGNKHLYHFNCVSFGIANGHVSKDHLKDLSIKKNSQTLFIFRQYICVEGIKQNTVKV